MPTVIILSLAVMIVGLTAFQTVSNSSTTLNDQYYRQLATEAAQAGIKAAQSCIAAGTTTWTNPLAPNTDCAGTVGSGVAYVNKNDNWQSTYSVGTPVVGPPEVVTSTGKVTLRTTSGTTLQTYTATAKGRFGQTVTTTPAKVVNAIATDFYHTCAIASAPGTTTGAAYCWGWNTCNENGTNGNVICGNGNFTQNNYPTAVSAGAGKPLNGKTVTSISVGSYAGGNYLSCATAYATAPSDAKAYCWGYGPGGIGVYGCGGGNACGTEPIQIGGLLATKTVTSISVGGEHICAVTADTLLYCWGGNVYREVGNGSFSTATSPVLINGGALAGKHVISVSAGFTYTCALAYTTVVTDAKPYCWGNNVHGELGDGTLSMRATPVAVIASGVLANKVITSISASPAWQAEDDGTGSGNTVTNPSGATCVTAYPSAGSAANTQAYCWGSNAYGSVGDGAGADRTSPVAVSTSASSALNGKTVVSVSASTHSCAVAYPTGSPTQTKAYCWGYNYACPVGTGTGNCNTIYRYPIAVATGGSSALNGKTVLSISTGSFTTCATAYTTTPSDAKAICWGANTWGAMGDGTGGCCFNYTYYDTPKPVDISASSGIGLSTTTTTGLPTLY